MNTNIDNNYAHVNIGGEIFCKKEKIIIRQMLPFKTFLIFCFLHIIFIFPYI